MVEFFRPLFGKIMLPLVMPGVFTHGTSGAPPVPPLLAGAKIATLGDSIIARGHGATFTALPAPTSFVSRSAGGTGYTVADILTVSGGTGVTVPMTVRVDAVSSGVVTTVSVVNFGVYATRPARTASATTGGTGTGCTIITGVSPGSTGSGYRVNDVVTVAMPGNRGVNGSYTVASVNAGGAIASLTLNAAGAYSLLDAVTAAPLTGGTGSGATLIVGSAANAALTGGIQNRANSEIVWARARSPRFIHENFLRADATGPNDIPTYGFASAQDNLWRGANFGYSGDTALGITRRVQQVINSGAQVCFLSVGTNTDAPNTAVEKIARIDAAVTALTAANIYVILGTIRPRWSGERATRNNVLSTTSGSAVIRLIEPNHGLTNTSAATKNMEFVSGGVTIAGLTLSGVISSGTGGYTVNVVDANTIDITCPTTANATVASGGGTFTYHRNTFVDAAGVNNVGLGLLPSDVRHQVHREVNDWIIAQAGRSKVVVADMTAALRDPVRSAATGVYLEPYPYVIMDGVHASARGAALGGAVIEAALAQIVQPGFAFDADPTVSNLLTNGRFTGTAGTANSGCSGTMPNNTFVSNVNGAAQPVTGVASVEANGETGGQTCVLALTSTGVGAANTFNTIRLSHTNPATGFVSTDWVQGIYEVELSGAESGIMPAFQATLGQSSTISNRGLGQTRSDYNTEPYPTENRRYWIMTEPLLVEARTSLNLRLDLGLRADLAGSVTVRVRRAFLRIVPNPATQFPWIP